MPLDYTDAVLEMLGEPTSPAPVTGSWDDLERELGVRLPEDYKRILDAYAPVQLNGHVYLDHPHTSRWNLGRWMRETVEAFSRTGLSEADCPAMPGGPVFGGPTGLIPLLSTDRGEYLFGLPGSAAGASGKWLLLSCDGDEQGFHEYRMPFSEWLYRHVIGEDMFGPGSAVFYPGPIVFESMPMTEEDPCVSWQGPERGM
ncbi:SMI1/KNR4 family protein [Streptomyces sp. NPDC093252]|uniref:SMI1/KNR4 family protein n=1 Tax=Streptomyces sp. NPDC093252 TaxID=3154980 RepID=UPI00342157A0